MHAEISFINKQFYPLITFRSIPVLNPAKSLNTNNNFLSMRKQQQPIFAKLSEFLKNFPQPQSKKSSDTSLTHKPISNQIFNSLKSLQKNRPRLLANKMPQLLSIVEETILDTSVQSLDKIITIITNNMKTCPKIYIKNNMKCMIRLIGLVSYKIGKKLQQITYKNLNQLFFQQQIDFNSTILTLFYQFELQSYFSQIKTTLFNIYSKGSQFTKAGVLSCFAELYKKKINREAMMDIPHFILSSLDQEENIVKLYAMYGFARFSEDYGKKFEELIVDKFLPKIIAGFEEKDTLLAIESMQCFGTVFSYYENSEKIEPYFERIIKIVWMRLEDKNSKYPLKANSLQILQNLMKIPRLATKDKLQKCLQIFFSQLTKKDNNVQDKACQMMTSLVKHIDMSVASDYVEPVFEKLIKVNKEIDQDNLMVCWKNLCQCGVMVKNWKPFYKNILNNLHTNSFKSFISDAVDFYQAIDATAKFYQSQFSQFSFPTLKILFEFLQKILKMRQRVLIGPIFCAINTIISNAKPFAMTTISRSWQKLIKKMIQYCISILQKSDEQPRQGQQQISEQDKFLQRHLQNKGQLPSVLSPFYPKVSKMLYLLLANILPTQNTHFKMEILQRILEIEKILFRTKFEKPQQMIAQQQEYDEDDVDSDHNIDQQSGILSEYDEWTCQSELSDDDSVDDNQIICFNACGRNINHILKMLVSEISDNQNIPQLLLNRAKQTEYQKDNVQGLVCDRLLIETIPYWSLQHKYDNFIKECGKYSMSRSASVRKIVTSCIGALVQSTPIQVINRSTIQVWHQIILNCYLPIKNLEELSEVEKRCKDGCTAALGKIIMKCHQNHDIRDLYDEWIEKLPLTTVQYEEQSLNQIQFLCSIIMNSPQILIQANSNTVVEKIVRVLKLFSRIKIYIGQLDRVARTKTMLMMAKDAVMSINNWNIFKQNQMDIVEMLTPKEKVEIDQFFK